MVDARNRIRVYEGERLVELLCIHLVENPISGGQVNGGTLRPIDSQWLPEADVVLGKVVFLECDEEKMLALANHHRP